MSEKDIKNYIVNGNYFSGFAFLRQSRFAYGSENMRLGKKAEALENFNSEKEPRFSNEMLCKLIIPLILEQFLGVFVGMADTIMISSAGETAVSGVSLVDTLNVLFFTVFSALATGGSVVSAHYIGQENRKKASHAGNQLIKVSLLAGLIIMLLCLIGNRWILRLVFGKIEPAVMNNALTYFLIMAFSLPLLACYNSCASLFRVMGNSKISLYCSIVMNVINIGGNALLLFVFHMGVAGVAIASLAARGVAMVVMLALLRKPENPIRLERFTFSLDGNMVRRILKIGVPNGLETGIFQIGKVLVLSLVAGFGTASIAANAVGNTVSTFQNMAGSAIGLAMITVVGQCIGAGEYDEAKYYAKKLLGIAYVAMLVVNVLLLSVVVPNLHLMFHLSKETAVMARQILIFSGIGAMTIWPLSFTLPNALRAAGDVNMPMVVAIASMWLWRVGLSVVLGKYLGMGVAGVWLAMIVDWLCRSVCFGLRFQGREWLYAMEKK